MEWKYLATECLDWPFHFQTTNSFQHIKRIHSWNEWICKQHDWMHQFSRLVISDSLRPHGLQHARLPCPSPTSKSLLKLMSIESVMPSNHLILCCPLLLLPLIFPSIRVFSNESILLIRWPKYWSFSFSINPSNEYSGLITYVLDLWIQAEYLSEWNRYSMHSLLLLLLSCVQLFAIQWTTPHQSSLSFTISWSLLHTLNLSNIVYHYISVKPEKIIFWF